jgi:hypothetical protein
MGMLSRVIEENISCAEVSASYSIAIHDLQHTSALSAAPSYAYARIIALYTDVFLVLLPRSKACDEFFSEFRSKIKSSFARIAHC